MVKIIGQPIKTVCMHYELSVIDVNRFVRCGQAYDY